MSKNSDSTWVAFNKNDPRHREAMNVMQGIPYPRHTDFYVDRILEYQAQQNKSNVTHETDRYGENKLLEQKANNSTDIATLQELMQSPLLQEFISGLVSGQVSKIIKSMNIQSESVSKSDDNVSESVNISDNTPFSLSDSQQEEMSADIINAMSNWI